MLKLILVPKKHWNSLTEQKNYKMRTIKKKEKQEEKKEKQATALEPFKALFHGINELFIPNIKIKKKERHSLRASCPL